jgi:hypothetical protein
VSFHERYAGIHNGGFPKLGSGDFGLWTGIPLLDRQKPIVAAKVAMDDSVQELCQLIDMVARRAGVEVYLAGRDFPMHVTLKQGKVDMPESGCADCSLSAAELIDQTWVFEHLVVAPTMIIGSEEAPALVEGTRQRLDEAFATEGLEPAALDIVHSTMARVVAFESPAGLLRYAADMLDIRINMAKRPLLVTVASIYWGTVAGLLEVPAAA